MRERRAFLTILSAVIMMVLIPRIFPDGPLQHEVAVPLKLIQVSSLAGSQDDELERILERSALYCEKLSRSVLYFICKEAITEEIYDAAMPSVTIRRSGSGGAYSINSREFSRRPQRVVIKNEYLYDYQLNRKPDGIKETRILLKETRKERNEADSKLKTRFQHKNIIMGPIGLLSSYWQLTHDYSIIKEGKFQGDRVYIIEATPNDISFETHLYGKIWVRKSDHSIMKIEWTQDGIDGYDFIQQMAESMRMKPEITLIAEYAFEKNGIRFPSKYQIIEAYRDRRQRKIKFSRTTVEYEDYRFFTVETEVKYSGQ